jgi:hypothetical protein
VGRKDPQPAASEPGPLPLSPSGDSDTSMVAVSPNPEPPSLEAATESAIEAAGLDEPVALAPAAREATQPSAGTSEVIVAGLRLRPERGWSQRLAPSIVPDAPEEPHAAEPTPGLASSVHASPPEGDELTPSNAQQPTRVLPEPEAERVLPEPESERVLPEPESERVLPEPEWKPRLPEPEPKPVLPEAEWESAWKALASSRVERGSQASLASEPEPEPEPEPRSQPEPEVAGAGLVPFVRAEGRGGPNPVALLALVALGLVGVVLATSLLPRPEPASDLTVPPSPTMEVAGRIAVEEDFDGLPMASQLPVPWDVSGAGSAQIVALPTSVDRSVRLRTGLDGTPTTACMPLGVQRAELAVAFDYDLGRGAPGQGLLLTAHSNGASVAGIIVDSQGRPVAAAIGDSPASASASPSPVDAPPSGETDAVGWQRLEVTLGGAEGVQWQAYDTSGAETGVGTALLADPSATVDTVCLHSPRGALAGWVAIDDLIIRG